MKLEKETMMLTVKVHQWKIWLRKHPNPYYRQCYTVLKRLRNLEIPTPKLWNRLLYMLCLLLRNTAATMMRIFVYTPAFKGRLASHGKQLYLYAGLPYISGPLSIRIGDRCRISGQTTFSGRAASHSPALIIGNNVGIGWQTTIAVGRKVILEDDVRIAGRAFLFGYPGHPLESKQRAEGLPDHDAQIGDIHLEKGVWLGSNVSVKGGVTIGEGTVVATGSVVTKSLPSYVLAAGNPARVLFSIRSQQTAEAD
jgi:acetyltransferase-like isoleucine patch superfamily enzyme